MMAKYADVITSIKNAKKDIKNDLISMFKEYNKTEIECVEFDSSPIIFSGMEDECMTLDSVVYNEKQNEIWFEGSGSYNYGTFAADSLDFELLFEVFSWICAYKDELFAEEDEE